MASKPDEDWRQLCQFRCSGAAVERVMANLGAVELPQLTGTNYHEWSLVLQVSLKALEQWDAMEAVSKDRGKDQRVLAMIIHIVPPKLKAMLVVKQTTKEAWEAVKMMRVGEDRVKEASRQRLLKEFENLQFKDDELIDDFAVRVNTLVDGLRELGEEVKDGRMVRKDLRVVPKKWKQVAVSIEMLLDLDAMSMEKLIGQLCVAEDVDADDAKAKEVATEGVDQLFLTEAQWEARRQERNKQRKRRGVLTVTRGEAMAIVATTATMSATTTAMTQAAWPRVQVDGAGAETRASASSEAATVTSLGSAVRRKGRARRFLPTSRSQRCCRSRVHRVKLRGVIVRAKLDIAQVSVCLCELCVPVHAQCAPWVWHVAPVSSGRTKASSDRFG